LKKNVNSSLKNLHSQNSSTCTTNNSKGTDFDFALNTQHYLNFINLRWKDIEVGPKIYVAEICDVYKGSYLHCPVAIKRYNVSKLTPEDINYISTELNILMCLRHPNIVTFIGKCIYQNQYLILTEYLERQSLKIVLENQSIELSRLNLLKMSFDIARAILYMHTRAPPVYHRDLKSSNCLVEEGFKVKLCDFGISKIFENLPGMKTTTTSTSFWMAPEFLKERIFTDKSDVYSFGILFWEIMHRDTRPYKDLDGKSFFFPENNNIRPKINKKILDKDIINLMQLCWENNPKDRPNIENVVIELEKLISLENKGLLK